jgi:hypothetical protein
MTQVASASDPNERLAFFGNQVLYFTPPHPHEQATITTQSEVEIEPVLMPDQETARTDLLATKTENSLFSVDVERLET